MRIACCQFDVVFNDPTANAARAVSTLRNLKAKGVDLAVFPEAFLTGYCVRTPEDARKIAIHRVSDPIRLIGDACVKLEMHALVGFAAKANGFLYNRALLITDTGEMHGYSKSHLPELGFDKFVQVGQELPVFETRFGTIGILICFDLRHPEAARVLALKGAELILLPTNWPNGATIAAEYFSIVRAAENQVFLATCDRVGEENGFSFVGLSKIIDPSGKVLAAAGAEEEVITADIDLRLARNKRRVVIPGEYEMTSDLSRRPELYGQLTQP